MSSAPYLEVRGIRKRFPGVLALDGVSARLNRGEVLAIVGENGAGKSTLMKILAGVYSLDEGTILLDGREVRFRGVADALRTGVCLIHQELNLADNLGAAANIFLGREMLWPFGWLRRGAMARTAIALMERVGLSSDLVNVPVEYLSPGQKQLIEIARALALDARILIMDEPTSSLTQGETDKLYEVIDELSRTGVSIVYISHRLAEVRRVADRVLVLRDGRNAGELARADITHDNLVRLMVGRDLKQLYPRSKRASRSQPRLEVRQLRYQGGPRHRASFRIGAGEIVGMAGLVGAGRTELAEAIFGIRSIVEGQVLLDGRPLRIGRPARAIGAGILLVPEDRRLHGLIIEESVGFNLSLPNLDRLSLLSLVLRSKEQALGKQLVERLNVRTPGLKQPVELLSGGNQQKIVFGKWLPLEPKVLILDEPTRGVNVGARGEIYSIIDQLASTGVAVWMISSDMEEVLGMSDRIVVLHEGEIAGELARDEFNEEAVMNLATGGPQTKVELRR